MSSIAKFTLPKTFRSGGTVRESYKLINNLFYKYGWMRTFRKRECVNAARKPIPWFSYPAIDFISQFDLSDKEVFEYGSGYSTLFWSERARNVVAVENFKDWYDKIKQKIGKNVTLIFSSTERHEYAQQIEQYGLFDIIVIDGIGESRLLGAELAKKHLKSGGMIILDNSDLWIKSAEYLRADKDLIQIDFTGFAPCMSNASTTSIFIMRDFDFQPHSGHQPHKSVAQPGSVWQEGKF